MRSMVGTGPGGFRSICFSSDIDHIFHTLIHETREELREYLETHARQFRMEGQLWREDESNFKTDKLRTFVRHEITGKIKDFMPSAFRNLKRSMQLAEAENEFMQLQVVKITSDPEMCKLQGDSFVLFPQFGKLHRFLQSCVVKELLENLLKANFEFSNFRIEYKSIEAILDCFVGGKPISGKVVNIQGNLAVSSNKRGVLVEPMIQFRHRRKRDNR